MPPYAFLANNELDAKAIAAHLVANRRVGVPYSDDMIASAADDIMVQATAGADTTALLGRYAKAVAGDFDGNPKVTEMDALIAYLQMLGTLVDFSVYEPEKNQR
jgi:cytochrome c oxidase cbb3-type subunit 2